LILVTTADGQFEVRESNHLLDAIEERGRRRGYHYPPRRFIAPLARSRLNMLVRLLSEKPARDVDCPRSGYFAERCG
jgi:hypothetical protein